jgi:hypothetical protein
MMDNEKKEKYPRQIVIGQPLWDYMEFCQVYCTAACCGDQAFEVHRALLSRKTIDYNLAGLKGREILRHAWWQVIEINRLLEDQGVQTFLDQAPIWKEGKDNLPAYWLDEEIVKPWFKVWQETFALAANIFG